MAKKKKIISISSKTLRELVENHQVTRGTVYNALAYRSNSELAQIIRAEAIKGGGVLVAKALF